MPVSSRDSTTLLDVVLQKRSHRRHTKHTEARPHSSQAISEHIIIIPTLFIIIPSLFHPISSFHPISAVSVKRANTAQSPAQDILCCCSKGFASTQSTSVCKGKAIPSRPQAPGSENLTCESISFNACLSLPARPARETQATHQRFMHGLRKQHSCVRTGKRSIRIMLLTHASVNSAHT